VVGVDGTFVANLSLPPGAWDVSVAAPGGDSKAKISDVKSQPGTVQFVFSAGNLAAGDSLDPKSVLVSVDGKTLRATASPTQAVDATDTVGEAGQATPGIRRRAADSKSERRDVRDRLRPRCLARYGSSDELNGAEQLLLRSPRPGFSLHRPTSTGRSRSRAAG